MLFIAAVLGFLTALAISATLYRVDLNSLPDWGITLSLLTLGFALPYFLLLPGAWSRFLGVPNGVRLWGILITITSAAFFSLYSGIGFLFLFVLAGFILTSYTLSSLHAISSRKGSFLFILTWVLAGLVSFFTVGFFKNFYPGFPQFIFLTIFFITLLTILFNSLIEQIAQSIKNDPKGKILPIAVVVLGYVLLVLVVKILVQYPGLFSSDFFLPDPGTLPVFFGVIILAQGGAAFAIQKLNARNWQASSIFLWTVDNLPGFLFAFPIMVSTYLMETALVRYDLSYMDIFFQTDSPWWLNFLTLPVDQMLIMRFVHPFILLILRPPVWLLSLFLNGDKYHAALLLNAAFGGVCVFLAWIFFKKRTGNTAYSLLIAALLGFSISHLVLSSLLESYIFSAAALIIFFMLAQSRDSKLWQLSLAGLVTFGITVTNFIQTCIDLVVIRRDIKLTFKYVVVVLSVAVLLALAQNLLYPKSDPFFLTNRYKSEASNMKDYSDMGKDQIIRDLKSRVNVTFRNTTLFSVVAPRPLIRYEGAACNPFCVRVMRRFRGEYLYASYIGFGSLLARSWFLGLVIAGLLFARQFFKSPNQVALQTALLLNVLFNFILHIRYGDDPLLYTPDWTYALVFFFGISFERWMNNKLLQVILLVFLIGLMINNLGLFSTILGLVQQFFP